MGLYDYLTCKYPLPDGWVPDRTFQTKDTPTQYLEHYKLDKDGLLWHRQVDYEDRSDPKAEGLARIIGSQTATNPRWVQVEFHGALCFYTSNWGCCFGPFIVPDDGEDLWTAEYTALFDHGKLLRLEGGKIADTHAIRITKERFDSLTREVMAEIERRRAANEESK